MLTGSLIGDFLDNQKKKAANPVNETKLSGYGFLAGVIQQHQQQ